MALPVGDTCVSPASARTLCSPSPPPSLPPSPPVPRCAPSCVLVCPASAHIGCSPTLLPRGVRRTRRHPSTLSPSVAADDPEARRAPSSAGFASLSRLARRCSATPLHWDIAFAAVSRCSRSAPSPSTPAAPPPPRPSPPPLLASCGTSSPAPDVPLGAGATAPGLNPTLGPSASAGPPSPSRLLSKLPSRMARKRLRMTKLPTTLSSTK
mmetsp:Transcript_16934/g.54272  ORF Transcript_16934/g.54272 Transcript_16934/m.54272 type:complete len:210 (-) Transcript_16934:816-1445(-)